MWINRGKSAAIFHATSLAVPSSVKRQFLTKSYYTSFATKINFLERYVIGFARFCNLRVGLCCIEGSCFKTAVSFRKPISKNSTSKVLSQLVDWPFPGYLLPRSQNESSCDIIHKMYFTYRCFNSCKANLFPHERFCRKIRSGRGTEGNSERACCKLVVGICSTVFWNTSWLFGSPFENSD